MLIHSGLVKSLGLLGFRLLSKKEHISIGRINNDGSKMPLALPNHTRIKSSSIRPICTQAGISIDEKPNCRCKSSACFFENLNL